jgi:hypothetical protein
MLPEDFELAARFVKDRSGLVLTRDKVYLLENRLIESLRDFNPNCLPVYSRDVLGRIRSGDPSWVSMVPPQVAERIKERNLFGYKQPPATT